MARLKNVITNKVDSALGIFSKALDQLSAAKSLIESRNTEIEYKIEELEEEQELLDVQSDRVSKAIGKIKEITG